MNINMGRHLTHLAFDEWDGVQQQKNNSFEIRVEEGTNEVMVFAPTLPGGRGAAAVIAALHRLASSPAP